ncbi:MAG: ATP-dependent metallopeptidase FtsH/Yme1/Tma family protein, partial [Microgenomates group bacterium]
MVQYLLIERHMFADSTGSKSARDLEEQRAKRADTSVEPPQGTPKASEEPVIKRLKTPSKQQTTLSFFQVPKNKKQWINRGLLYLFLAMLFLPFLASTFSQESQENISLSRLVTDIRAEQVEKIEVSGTELRVIYTDGTTRIAQNEESSSAISVLESAGIDLTQVNVEVENLSSGRLFWEVVINVLPIALMVLFFIYIFRQAKGGQDGIMGIGRSKAKVFVKGKQSTTFADVGGMDEAKKELEEIVDFLKHPKKYTKVGARTPKGVLLVGPAGTGKTLLARAVAGEAGVQFLSIAGSEFMEMLVGVGASRVRDLFTTAKKLSPAIIFIDEIDAIGR